MALGTQTITAQGYRTVYTVPAGRRATVNAIAYANGGPSDIAFAARTPPSPTTYASGVQDVSISTTFTGPGVTNSYMGWSVAEDGDYAVVGIPGPENTVVGQIRIYFYNGTAWTLQQTIVDPNNDPDSQFGYAVAISGDQVLVGSPGDDASGTNTGRAYRYSRSGTTWSLAATYTNTQTSAFFGRSVAIAGDYIVIGAPFYNQGSGNEGAVFGFRISSGTGALFSVVGQDVYSANALYGTAVAVWTNGRWVGGIGNGGYIFYYNSFTGGGGSFQTTQAGTFGSNLACDKTGSQFVVATLNTAFVYVYTVSPSGSVSLSQTINNPTNSATESFGRGLAIDATGNILIGSPGLTVNSVASAGGAYLYTPNALRTSWTLLSTILNPSPVNSDQFGYSVAIHGVAAGTTGSGNAYAARFEYLIGTPFNDAAATNAGNVIFYGGGVTTTRLQNDADAIAPVMAFATDRITLPVNQTFERTGLVLDAGESLIAVLPTGSGNVNVQARGFEEIV
jgi:hypothetical protein